MGAILEPSKLCVLITNTQFARRTGSELYVRDLALALRRHGHTPVVYSPRLGPLADILRARSIPVVDDLDALGRPPDLIHGQHHLETMAALARFPHSPALFACHGWLPWQEAPPLHPRILHYLAVSEAVHDRLVFQGGVPPDKITMTLNFVDLDLFLPRSPLPARPARALVFSNQASELNYLGTVREACASRGITLDVAGYACGLPCDEPERLLGNYDLVFARGRAAIESLATGAAVICCDLEGLGDMVTPANLERMRQHNFGLRTLDQPIRLDLLEAQIDRYDAASAMQVSRQIRASAGLDQFTTQIIATYRDVLCQWQTNGERTDPSEGPALYRYLRQVSVMSQALEDEVNRWRQCQAETQATLVKQQHETSRLGEENVSSRKSVEFWQAEHANAIAQADALRVELDQVSAATAAAQAALESEQSLARAQWQQSQVETQAAHASQLAAARAEASQLNEIIGRLRDTLTWRWRERLLSIEPMRRAYLFVRSPFRHRSPTEARATAPVDRIGASAPTGDQANPQLACVVMALANPATLVNAVRSLQQQDAAVEIVVVNSGGGNPLARLRAAGIEVKVVNRPDRLFPGAVRNLGIAATTAPLIAFLAADCTAEPNWASSRIARHLAGRRAVSSAVTPARPRNLWSWVSYLNLFAMRMPGVPGDRVLHYGVSYERAVFEAHGGFREDLRSGEDSEFNRRLTGIEFDWAPEVRAAHEHPTTLVTLLRDQFGRGARMAAVWHLLSGRPIRRRVAIGAFRRVPGLLRTAWKAAEPGQRRYQLAATLLMPPAVLAYALGAVAGTAPKAPAPASGSARPRILALLTFHDEMRYLPDYFLNIAPHVDGIIALDDGSDDGSGEFVEAQASVLELIRLPKRRPHHWDEPRNRRLLVEAALRHGADWLLVLDADERVERDFRARADVEMERAENEGTLALRLVMRELWNHADHFRCDGIWDRKRPVRMFKARPDHHFDDRPLHGHWAPLNSLDHTSCRDADLVIYHLRMLTEIERRARQAKYQRLDPNSEFQEIGYDYLTDTADLQLEPLPRQREYLPVHRA